MRRDVRFGTPLQICLSCMPWHMHMCMSFMAVQLLLDQSYVDVTQQRDMSLPKGTLLLAHRASSFTHFLLRDLSPLKLGAPHVGNPEH